MIGAIEFDTEIVAAGLPGRDQGRARAAEGVQHQSAFRTERANQRGERRDWLLRRMQAIAAIGEVDHIGWRMFGQHRAALRQHVGRFVRVADEP